jgi:hypothetical protein
VPEVIVDRGPVSGFERTSCSCPPPPPSPLDVVNGHVLGASDIHICTLSTRSAFQTKYRTINTEEEQVACIHTARCILLQHALATAATHGLARSELVQLLLDSATSDVADTNRVGASGPWPYAHNGSLTSPPGPAAGFWNDLDILERGNGDFNASVSPPFAAQVRSHSTLWSTSCEDSAVCRSLAAVRRANALADERAVE